MSASPALSARPYARLSIETTTAAILFAVVGALIGILAFAFQVASIVAPAELGSHPVGEALLRATPLLVVLAVVHVGLAAALLVQAPFARAVAAFVALAGLGLWIVEIVAIVTGHDPVGAESADPARAAQSGLEASIVIALVYAALVGLSLRSRAR